MGANPDGGSALIMASWHSTNPRSALPAGNAAVTATGTGRESGCSSITGDGAQ
jgi:hypothetical protein